MVKIGLPWLLLVLMKLTNREIKSDEIISLQEVYDICQVEPSTDICDLLDKSTSIVDINKLEMPEKRRQKTVFSSWGGKRQSAYPYGGKRPAFSSWGGKRGASDKHGRPKQTFSSWGGKRSEVSDGYDNGEMLEHQMEKRELNEIKQKDKKNYKNQMTKGIHALFTIFSEWSRDPEEKKGIQYTGLKSMRRSSDFFPWGGKRSSRNSE